MTAILVYVFIGLAYGAASCFFGKNHFKTLLAAAVFCSAFTCAMEFVGPHPAGIAISLAVALAVSVSAVLINKLGLFLYGAITGVLAGVIVCYIIPGIGTELRLAFLVVLGIAAGIFTLKWGRNSVIVPTVINGAAVLSTILCFVVANANRLSTFIFRDGFFVTAGNLHYYIKVTFTSQYAVIILIVSVAIAAVGFVLQRKNSNSNKRQLG